MKVWSSLYELHPRKPISALARAGARTGALLKVEHPGVGIGYGDCHPWEELGDAPLPEQLRALAEGRPTPLVRASLGLSERDAAFRARRKSCFEGLSIPPSHFLLTDREDPTAVERAVGTGFGRIKIKLGKDLDAELRFLLRLFSQASDRARFRLDFNSCLNGEQFAAFLDRIGPDVGRIDFIEDPTPWSPATGFPVARGVRLAVDREACAAAAESACPDVLILKPAIDDPRALLDRAREWRRELVVTSYLDHPLGQVSAAWIAARCAREAPEILGTCGLISHPAYEPNEFSDALFARGPKLDPPHGTGWGFDDLLEKRDWRRVC